MVEERWNAISEIVCRRLGVNGSDLRLDARFIADLGADSLDLTELVLELEERFGILIPESDLSEIQTVADAVRIVEARSKS